MCCSPPEGDSLRMMRGCVALLAYNGLRLHLLRHDAVYNEELHVWKAWSGFCLGHHIAVLHHHSRLGRSQAC